MKVLVAHPGKQHSYRMATALKKDNLLDVYVTTIYYKNHNLTSKIFWLLNQKDLKKAKLRKCEALDDREVVQKQEMLGLLILLTSRLHLKKITSYLNLFMIKSFGKAVARLAIKHGVDAVVMYDNTAVPCFKYLQTHAPKIKRILDASTVNRLYIKGIYDKDMEVTHTDFFYKQLPFLWNSQRQKVYKKEIELSDFILLPSNFVLNSYLFSGASKEKLIRIPYGVDIDKFTCRTRMPHDGMVNLVYVGQVTYYKGLHHLLPIIRDVYREKIALTIVGGYDETDYLYKNFKDVPNITFLGYVPNNELPGIYQKMDAFIIPSLGEGCAMVIFEALGTGLPVLCSANSGGNDIITNGYNGYVFEAGNDKDMMEKIDRFIANMPSLQRLSENARKSAKNYTWETYEHRVQDFFHKIDQENVRKSSKNE